MTGLVPQFQKSAFGFYKVGMQSITDGSSNTVLCAEVLQGETVRCSRVALVDHPRRRLVLLTDATE